jgi:hypothetical protein
MVVGAGITNEDIVAVTARLAIAVKTVVRTVDVKTEVTVAVPPLEIVRVITTDLVTVDDTVNINVEVTTAFLELTTVDV